MAEKRSIFERLEKKYLLSTEQYDMLINILNTKMEDDEYTDYTICNIYLDTWDYRLIRASIDKPIYKEKLRLRSYGVVNSDEPVFLEVKKKYNGIVYKRRASMTLQCAEDYIDSGIFTGEQGQIMREIDWAMKMYNPQPQIYIAYDRIALKGIENEELRITFDSNIRWRTEDLSLSSDAWGHSLLEDDQILMEIKALGAMPTWLTKALSYLHIYPISFSKYGACYKLLLTTPSKERNFIYA